MLKNAGLTFECIPADIDEQALQKRFTGNNPAELAVELARAKALSVSESHPACLVIGADQVLEINGNILTKAANKEEALDKLRTLKGTAHTLISAVTVAEAGKILWQDVQGAHLTMHDFDENFLQNYAAHAGDGLTAAVGAYELEGAGAWLFDKVEGDYFTILGMPLLPLLSFLRTITP